MMTMTTINDGSGSGKDNGGDSDGDDNDDDGDINDDDNKMPLPPRPFTIRLLCANQAANMLLDIPATLQISTCSDWQSGRTI